MARTRGLSGSAGQRRRLGGALALTAGLVTASLTASEVTSGPATEHAAAVAVATVGGGNAAQVVAGPSGGFLVTVLTSGGQWAHVIEDAAFTVRAWRVENPRTAGNDLPP
jgi:multisubunit Na+/H+ antiporter MnhB subunit